MAASRTRRRSGDDGSRRTLRRVFLGTRRRDRRPWAPGGASHFAIEGPNILTPGGNRIQGNYSRHGFTYVVPVNEAGAGGEINMVLLNEEMVSLTRKGETAAPEIWRRVQADELR